MRKYVLLLLPVLLAADEGIWLVNQFPRDAVKKAYGVDVTDAFLQKLQRASARFNNGGSGSFVSPHGLLFTNHHVGRDCIQKVSTAEHDYIANGFYAASESDEKKCPDLEINILMSIENVTQKVKAADKPGMSPAEINKARRESMSRLEKECSTASGNRCDVVTLYSGGRYDLYQYKKYTDIRLVFAPEESIAAFGGDPDNFNYPRYCLDFSFFRAYENGKPLESKDYFPWSKKGVKDKELTFVSGNPGSTGRLNTLAQLEFFRDVQYPFTLQRHDSVIQALLEFGKTGEERKRISGEALLTAQNSFKAYTGFLAGLRDPQLMGRKKHEEETLRASVDRDPEKKKDFGAAWDDIAAAYQEYRKFLKPYVLSSPLLSDYFDIARNVLRLPVEKKKPSEQRLREYRDSNLASIEQEVFSEAPINDELEITLIAAYLRLAEKELGPKDPVVAKLVSGATPELAARAFVGNSKLKDVAERKRLAASAEAVEASSDGMLKLARILDGRNRELRKRFEDRVEAALTTSAARIAQARFAAEGEKAYPDATFTFRISYGSVKGYTVGGKPFPYATVFSGVFDRATGVDPFKLPKSFVDAKSRLNLQTPFNFVSTCDTHGGNSGSPTVNAKGEVVGILFDGNIEGLPNRFVYQDSTARSVHVASQGIVEALRSVYKATRVTRELGFRQ